MHESELKAILRGEGRGDRRWPPGRAERVRWQQVAEYRRRVENDAAELFRWRVDLHVQAAEGGAEATHERQKVFSPVGMARDLARFSSSLLFSEEPKIRLDDELSVEQERLDAWIEANRGGEVAISVEEEHNSAIVWRLLESHSPGLIERVLFKGGADRLGKLHPLTAGPPEFRELRPQSR